MSPSAPFMSLLNTSRYGNSAISLSSLFHCLITFSCELIFHSIQSKPPLLQPGGISSHPIICFQGKENDIHLFTTSFWIAVESNKVSSEPPSVIHPIFFSSAFHNTCAPEPSPALLFFSEHAPPLNVFLVMCVTQVKAHYYKNLGTSSWICSYTTLIPAFKSLAGETHIYIGGETLSSSFILSYTLSKEHNRWRVNVTFMRPS